MEFREIDIQDYVNEKVPFAIMCIFKWDFEYGKMYQRFIKLNDSFALYLDWKHFKQEMIEGKVFNEDGEVFTNESIEPYLKSYSNGFVKGYHDLENEIKETTSIFQVTNNNIADRVFSILNVMSYPFSARRYLNDPETNTEKPIVTHKDLERDARAVGRYYKAWFFVMNNPDLFIERFKAFHIESYKLIEAELRERNKHHEGYKTELQDIIDGISTKEAIPNYEVALRHWFLETAKLEPMIFGKEIINRYGAKKVEVFINELRKDGIEYSKKGLHKQLTNVYGSLKDYPEIQKNIQLHLDKLE